MQQVKVPEFVYKMVDKKNSLGNFEPDILINIPAELSTREIQVHPIILKDLIDLLEHALKNHINLKVTSGYRSFSYQKELFEKYIQQELERNPDITRRQAIKIANTHSAKPGHSEHQLGTTVDILSEETNFSFNGITSEMKFAKWLKANSGKYNFQISYPEGNTKGYIPEPWHLRWLPNSSN